MSPVDLRERVALLTPEARERLAARLGVAEQNNTSPAAAERTSVVAYYVSTTGHPVPAEELRQFLSKTLPGFLVPSLFCHIESVPRTVHGKVDTAALPDPLSTVSLPPEHNKPAASDIEVELLDIWKAVLGVDRLDVQDSFFELGGDSLLGIRLLGQIRERWSIDLTMTSLFDHPTVAGAAAQIEAILWARNSHSQRRAEGSDEQEEVEF